MMSSRSNDRTTVCFGKHEIMIVQKLLSVVYFLVCFTGLLFQIHQICLVYFSFRTNTQVKYSLNPNTQMPQVALCFRYVDILDRRNYKMYDINERPPQTLEEVVSDQTKLTSRQIFNLTPSPDDIFSSCEYRSHRMFYLKKHEQKDCYQEFEVKRWFYAEYVCYSIRDKRRPTYSITRLARSINSHSIAYSLVLNEQFDNADLIMPVVFVSTEGSIPWTSQRFAKIFERFQYDSKTKLKKNKFTIYYQTTESRQLEAPYDTKCTARSNKISCHVSCLEDAMKKYEKIFPKQIIREPEDFRLLSLADLQNSTWEEIAYKVDNHCSSSCNQKSCKFRYTFSKVFNSMDKRLNRSSLFQIMTCERPLLELHSRAQITIVEFFVYISSSLGIWFGISIWSFNPGKWTSSLERKSLQRKNNKTTQENMTSISGEGKHRQPISRGD